MQPTFICTTSGQAESHLNLENYDEKSNLLVISKQLSRNLNQVKEREDLLPENIQSEHRRSIETYLKTVESCLEGIRKEHY